MGSRGSRLTLVAAACLVLGAAASFLIRSEQYLSAERRVVREFDGHADAATAALADARAAQQAYVAAGQTPDLWQPKAAAFVQTAASAVDLLRTLAATTAARASLMDAAATITELANVDHRARDYLASEQPLMAADLVFAEVGEVSAAATRQIQAARTAEYERLAAAEAAARPQQALALAAGAGVATLMLLTLALARGAPATRGGVDAGDETGRDLTPPGESPLHRIVPARAAPPPQAESIMAPRNSTPALNHAAQLCTEIARARDAADLTRALGRVADAMDASGLIVWTATAAGGDLWPVLAHGYPPQTLARMTAVPRSGDNATAAAYRTGALQIVLNRPGVSSGALVAPLLAPAGCVGALTAEIRGGSETSDGVQALTTLVAAQLTTILAVSGPAAATDVPEEKSATG